MSLISKREIQHLAIIIDGLLANSWASETLRAPHSNCGHRKPNNVLRPKRISCLCLLKERTLFVFVLHFFDAAIYLVLESSIVPIDEPDVMP